VTVEVEVNFDHDIHEFDFAGLLYFICSLLSY
jgi:hypothetical protein